MRETILAQLDAIEREHDVTILFAIESGSRAWGFPSADSDYDVRFVYARPLEWYLSITPGRDVIELPVDPVLDINGWDVRKALQLLRKSNISLMEWISSPIEYKRNQELSEVFNSVVPLGFDRHSSVRHYLSMAKFNRQKTDGEHVRIKSYLYAIRPILCCKWILVRETQPPMLFRDLVTEFLDGTAAGDTIHNLIATKETQSELETVPKNTVLDEFIASEFDSLTAMLPNETELPDPAPFDDAFRKIIALIGNGK
ncbi:MAG TPA: nucleotidyltransferase domain-containing protein [Pirellulaceae bacterium]|nr:nucleotidyltransferase domain-containing protein [Pirellulaceae bacterium]HMO92580.1 nucleotidyltransferase domain-containing protein [Pirellulaceae bacterium]HMP70622.1 nucleotidyltransferase domain-containing protein [Pirellulaceae bacterium]